jgi:predicted permease
MEVSVVALILALAAGLTLQRAPASERLRDVIWTAYLWTVLPAIVLVTFLDLHADRQLVLTVAAAILATWAVALVGLGYAKLVSSEQDEQGALTLAIGWANTGFLGYPMAQLAFGAPGLALAVLYDRLSWLVPPSSVSLLVARHYGRRHPTLSGRHRVRLLMANPPMLALAAALLMRSAGATLPGAHTIDDISSAIVGPAGFLLLGLSLPLERPAHERGELGRAAGALAIRFAGGPLALYAIGALLGARVPHVFYLMAAMPPAFHLLVLARVYDLRPALTRLLVVSATLAAVPIVVALAIFGGLH